MLLPSSHSTLIAQSIVNVDFDFCDFRAQTDYLSMKRLLQQLFHTDATLFDLGSIADAILAQDDVGSTVKTDGVESDPFAFIALLAIVRFPLMPLAPIHFCGRATQYSRP